MFQKNYPKMLWITITITRAGDNAGARQIDERNKGVVFENCTPFINCISEISIMKQVNTQEDDAKDLNVVMYNLTEYSDNYSKTSEILWQYYRDEANANLADSELFKSRINVTGNTPDGGIQKMLK